ncbi:MAG: DUF72 domain-containing protein [Candidatus Acidiferrales bacterium]
MAGEIRLGTSSFTADGWNGSFYPKGTKSSDYLGYYSSRFDTVEVDSTFYRCPTIEAVRNWALKTPPGFIFSLKVPRTITHEKVLVDCDKEFEQFVNTVDVLGEKLGPMVLQFPFFDEEVFTTPVQFESRLKAFFVKLPRVCDYRFAVEIRNKYWLKPRLLDVLRENNVALVLQDQSWMPRPKDLENYDLITTDFSYIRWLGNRKDIEKLTTTWNSTIIDRTADLQTWVDVCEKIQKRGITQYVYANNHYSGFAPATVELFRSLCKVRGIETPLNVEVPAAIEPTLFDISPN